MTTTIDDFVIRAYTSLAIPPEERNPENDLYKINDYFEKLSEDIKNGRCRGVTAGIALLEDKLASFRAEIAICMIKEDKNVLEQKDDNKRSDIIDKENIHKIRGSIKTLYQKLDIMIDYLKKYYLLEIAENQDKKENIITTPRKFWELYGRYINKIKMEDLKKWAD